MAISSFSSIPDMFLHRVRSTPDSEAFLSPKNGGWARLSWGEVGADVRDIAMGLMDLGVALEDRVAILAGTRVEWLLADIGVMCAGGATTTIYPSNTAEECAFIIADSGSRVVFAEDQAAVEKLVSARAEMPALERVVVFDGHGGEDGWVITLDALRALGQEAYKADSEAYEARARSVKAEHLATLIYTSGTTGRPKGVELLHDCWVFEAEAMETMGTMAATDRQLLFLPMAHVFAKLLGVAIIKMGIPTAIDGSIDRLVENMGVVRPTFMAAVPRVFEKVYNKVLTGAHDAGGLKLRIFRWSMAQGYAVSKLRQAGEEPWGLLSLKHAIADRLVFSKLRNTFGGQIRFFISGGAPLSRDIAEFFHAAGIHILEGYGLTESCAASFVNTPGAFKFGTVGPPLQGVEYRLDAADGEILIKGRGVMRGYRNQPELTAEVLEDGWLRTGDIGEVTEEGYLRITDRKKDLIKTSGGKYVAPQKLENKLKSMSTLVSQVLVHGNTRNFCTALVTLNEEEIAKWAEDNGLGGTAMASLAHHKDVRALIDPLIDTLNADLARYETIKKYAILDADFSQEAGDLTPTMKVKRRVVEAKYKDVLDGFYEGAIQSV
jgi:long-chain acyl-CoA synthetase